MARRKKQNALAGRYPRGRLVRRALHDYFVRLPCRELLDILAVNPFPPIPQSPLFTSSITTQVT